MENEALSRLFDDGVFKELFLDYIGYKRSCGLQYEDSAPYILRCLNRRLNEYGVSEPVLTKTMVEALCVKRPHETYATQSRRIAMLRQFSIFLQNRGIEVYIYPRWNAHGESSSFVPYIFSEQEIASIFSVADCLPRSPRYPIYSVIYPVLLRLLYSCGLRLSEALSLRCRDVDLEEGTLYIEKSKNRKTRLVPMSGSMTAVCRDYSREMQLQPKGDTYFFLSPNGGKYSRPGVRGTIQRIYAKAGVPKLPNGRYPRVHDLRHTQAVYALMTMQSTGRDLYYSLPILCAFLGHKDLTSTEKYLRLPYFKHEEVALSSRELVPGLIPEVHWDEE